MLFMKLQSHILPFLGATILSKILSHKKIKNKKLVYCNVFGMVSPSVFGINVFLNLKKKF